MNHNERKKEKGGERKENCWGRKIKNTVNIKQRNSSLKTVLTTHIVSNMDRAATILLMKLWPVRY